MTAFNNSHGAKIQPSAGYRIDYKGKSAVLSGDTHKSQTVIYQSKGVDLLVHEVAAVRPELLKTTASKTNTDLSHHPNGSGRSIQRGKT